MEGTRLGAVLFALQGRHEGSRWQPPEKCMLWWPHLWRTLPAVIHPWTYQPRRDSEMAILAAAGFPKETWALLGSLRDPQIHRKGSSNRPTAGTPQRGSGPTE